MNLTEIKTRLEKIYCVGFHLRNNDGILALTLKESDKDKFEINMEISDQVRMKAWVSMEKYAASFLHLINNSSYQKRKNFIDLMNTNSRGSLEIIINNSRIDTEDFLTNSAEWKTFLLQFNEFPFEDDDKEIIRVFTLLLGMVFSLFDYSIEGYEEGECSKITVNKYERNPVNRQICLAYKGYSCSICGFNFESQYGEAGKNLIEVHHITPVSELGKGYIIHPLEDLIPVCSNCHTVIHRKNPPYTLIEMREMINKKQNG